MSQTKKESRNRRKNRIRKKIFGTPEKPRFSVYRSLRHVYAQLIDDLNGKTVVEASSLKMEKVGGGKRAACEVGKLIAQRAKSANIQKAAFDRNGYIYHGVVQTLAESARKEGLQL